jgi:hypothetical protein
MNGIDEFIELSLGLFAVITGLIVLLTYMERSLQGQRCCSAGERPTRRDRPYPTLVVPPAA